MNFYIPESDVTRGQQPVRARSKKTTASFATSFFLCVGLFFSGVMVVQAASLTISGTIFGDDRVSVYAPGGKTGPSVLLAVATGTVSVFSTNASPTDGSWTLTIPDGHGVTSGTPITAFINNNVADASTITRAAGVGDITGFDLYRDHVTIRNEGGAGTSTRASDLYRYDGTNDADILFTASSSLGRLTVDGTQTLYVASGTTFALDLPLVAGDLETATTATALASSTLTISGDFIQNGVFAAATNTVWTTHISAEANPWSAITYGNGLFVAVALSGSNQVMTSPDGVSWSGQSAAALAEWTSVVYGGGQFVAVCAFNSSFNECDEVMTSPDGVTWTTQSAEAGFWNTVTYGNGLFVAVGEDAGTNQVMTSPNGITWTVRTPAEFANWSSVTYGNGLFVAVALGGSVMTSPDGITWTTRTAAASSDWRDIAYGNGLFVAVADLGGTKVMTSPDGITWTARIVAEENEWNSVTYGNGLFVAVAQYSRPMTSPDGIAWTTREANSLNGWSAITYGNGLFVAVCRSDEFFNASCDQALVSPESRPLFLTGTNSQIFSGRLTAGSSLPETIVISGSGSKTFTANASTTDIFIASTSGQVSVVGSLTVSGDISNATSALVVSDALYLTGGAQLIERGWGGQPDVIVAGSGQKNIRAANASTSNFIVGTNTIFNGPNNLEVSGSYTNNGTAGPLSVWNRHMASEANEWISVTYGNGLFVAVAGNGTNRVMTSPDGITWTARTAAEVNPWTNVTYGNGLFVAVAGSGTNRVMTSGDGITWTARAATEANYWTSVTYGNGLFVAVSLDGTNRVMTSPDGITWTARSAAEANQWQSVTYGNGLFVAVASTGTNRVMTSPDGITWTSRVAEDSGWTDITYGNGLFVAVSPGGFFRVMTSPDGITWTGRTTTVGAGNWSSITFGNGLFVAVAYGGTNRVMTSPDAITWTERTATEASSWNSVTYGNDLFVAVSGSGSNRVMTSAITNTYFTNAGAENAGGNMTGTNALGNVFINSTARREFTSNASTSNLTIVSTSSTLFAPQELSVRGNYANNGTFDNQAGTTTFNGDTPQTLSGSMNINAVSTSPFYSVVVTNPAGVRPLDPIQVEDDLIIASGGVFNASSTLTIGGDFAQNGTFLAATNTAWTARTAAEANQWSSVTYGNGLFVAVSQNGTNRVMTSPDGITWTARTAAAANFWSSVTYGNGLFVAVAGNGTNRVMTSPDGITWTARTAAEANVWTSVTYGNGLFVAVCSFDQTFDFCDTLMTSPDGITWTARTAVENNQWTSVTYGNGLFVAVASGGTNRVMTSLNGITWTARTAAEASQWSSITYGNGLFVAVADCAFGGSCVMTSPDGITWTARTGFAEIFWRSITYGNGLFVAVAFNGVMTSPDGITWTTRSAAEANFWNSVTYGNGLFVAVGTDGINRIMTAELGLVTFNGTTEQTLSGTLHGSSSFADVRFSNSGSKTFSVIATTSSFFINPSSGTVIASSGLTIYGDLINSGSFTAPQNLYLSGANQTVLGSWDGEPSVELSGSGIKSFLSIASTSDLTISSGTEFIAPDTLTLFGDYTNYGTTSYLGGAWTARTAAAANSWNSVTYGNGLFVAVASDGTNRVMTSGDGITWTARTAAAANSWNSVTYGNGLFVAVAFNGVMTSPDGITWTTRSAAEANFWNSVTYGNGLFVAVASGGTNRVMTSLDGVTWTARSAATASGWISITYGNGLFVAVAFNAVMTSLDGVTWTTRSAAEANDWRSITYGNGLFVAVSITGTNRVMTSLDGITWTARTAAEANQWRSVTYGNGLFVAVANTGTNRVMISPDGITWTARTAAAANSWTSVTYGNGLFVAVASDGTNRVMTSAPSILMLSGVSTQIVSGSLTGVSALGSVVIANASNPVVFDSVLEAKGTFTATVPGSEIHLAALATSTLARTQITGTLGSEIKIRSTVPGDRFGLLLTDEYSITGIDLADSSGSTSAGLIETIGIDSGNNVGWSFNLFAILLADGTVLPDTVAYPSGDATTTSSFVFSLDTATTTTVTELSIDLEETIATSGIARLEVASADGLTVFGSTTDFSTFPLTVVLNEAVMSVSGTPTEFHVRVVPKSHADMPSPLGDLYSVITRVSSWESEGLPTGEAGFGRTVTIDNLSPAFLVGTSSIALPVEDFESGILTATTTGDALWEIDTVSVGSGVYSAKAGIIDNESESVSDLIFVLDVAEEGSALSFERRTSSEESYDFLTLYINGIEIDSWSGENAWSVVGPYPLETGLQTVRFSYSKDDCCFAGDDAAWVDAIEIIQEVDIPLTATTTGAVSAAVTYFAPADSDYVETVILYATTTFTDVPAEGVIYTGGETIGSTTVGCVDMAGTPLASSTCDIYDLTPLTPYYLKLFARDLAGNYSLGLAIDNFVPGTVEALTSLLTLMGTVFEQDRSIPYTSGGTVSLVVASSTPLTFSTSTEITNGTFAFAVDAGLVATGTPLLVYFDEEPGFNAVTVTKTNGTTTISDFDLYGNHVTIRNEGGSGTTTKASELSFFDGTDDADLLYTASSTLGRMTINPTQTLYIAPNTTFDLDLPVVTANFELASTATTLASSTLNVSGNFKKEGAYVSAPPPVWTRGPGISGNIWSGITYGNGLFVAIASGGTNQVMTSQDGITWTARTAANTNSWQAITYGNGLFVAISTDATNQVMTSPDGITWTARTTPEANLWLSITYGNGLFVAVGAYIGVNRVMTSPDGITWTARTAAENNNWFSVTYGNGLFVAVAISGTNRVMTSLDGITWTARTAAENNNWVSVTYGNGLFVAVANTGINRIMTSGDGITWTARAGGGTNSFVEIGYGNGLFVALAESTNNAAIVSPDGVTWSRQVLPLGVWSGITFGNGQFVAVEGFGSNQVARSVQASPLYLTGSTTQLLSGNLTGVGAFPVLYTSGSGNKIFEVVASTTDIIIGMTSGQIQASTSLSISGSVQNTSAPLSIADTLYLNGGDQTIENGWIGAPDLVVLGTGQKNIEAGVASTSDFTIRSGTSFNSPQNLVVTGDYLNEGTAGPLSAWTPRISTNTNSDWTSITYGNGLFVAVSQNGTNRVMTSLDGITWTARTAAEANSWQSVAFGEGLFVAVSTNGTNRVMTSLDGITWTARTAAENNNWTSVTYGNGQFVAVASTGTNRVMTSLDGITWTARTAAENNNWTSVTYGNGQFVAVASTGTNRVMTSPDGITWTARTAAEASNWISITYGNGLFVAVTGGGTFRVMTSPDGITWTRRIVPSGQWNSVAYGEGMFVATAIFCSAVCVMTSPDGINWITNNPATRNSWPAVTYGNGQFVAVAFSGDTYQVITSTFSTTTFNGTGPQSVSGSLSGSSAFGTVVVSKEDTPINFTSALQARSFISATPGVTISLAHNATSTFNTLTIGGAAKADVLLRSTDPGEQFNLVVEESYNIVHLDVADGNACGSVGGGINVFDGTSVDSGNNDCFIFINEDPGLALENNLEFYVGQATTTLPTITVTDVTTPEITALGDIRLTIATTTTNFRFDTSDTTPVFGGSAAGKVASAVTFEDAGATLRIDVTENFSATNTLTISGVAVGSFAAVSTTTSQLGLYISGNATGTPAALSTQTIRILGSIAVSDHSDGQVGNEFSFNNKTEETIFAFALDQTGETATVTDVVITISGLQGVTTEELVNFALYEDVNSDAVLDGGDVLIDDAGIMTINGQNGAVTFSSNFLVATRKDYIVVADTVSIDVDDTLVLSLRESGITALGEVATLQPIVISTVEPVQHARFRSGGGGGTGRVGGNAPPGGGTETGGGSGGGGGGAGQEGDGENIAPDVDFKKPTATGSQHNEWTNPANAYDSDGTYTTAATAGLRQTYSGFNFGIPAGNTIQGITVKLDASGSALQADTIDVALSWDGGSSYTSAKATPSMIGSDVVYSVGGASDTWGRAWTSAELSTETFRLRVISNIANEGNSLFLDALEVRVFHQAGGGGSGGGPRT